MRKTLIMLTSVVMAALFIGTSMTTAIARESLTGDIAKEVEIKDNAISEEAQAIEQEPECTECAAVAAATEASQSVEIGAQTLIADDEEECDPCEELINEAFEDTSSYILNNLPEFNMDDWELFYILEYVLDVRDVFIVGIGIGIATLVVEFAQYLDDAVAVAIGTFLDRLLNGDHLITAVGKAIVAVVEFFIQVCLDLLGGDGGNTQSAPLSAPVSAPVSAPASIPMNTMSAGETATRSTQYGSMGL